MSYFQSLRRALFASRIKAMHLRSHRCRGAAAKGLETRLEPLEKRIALDASVDAAFQRPLLTQNQSIYLYPGEDASQGPLPVVFGKSDIVGNDADSFIVTGVVNGVVEKWDAATKTWQDVSTKPTSSNPVHLLKHLRNRHVRPTDRVRWVPDSGTRTAAPSQAFTSLAWNTGSETDSDCPESTVTYVSSSFQASGAVNGDAPVSTASKTTEDTCSCGCPTASEPVGNFSISPTETGGLRATWDSDETEPTIIPAIYENVNNPSETVSRDGWGLMISSDKRFEASDLVWHEGLQRFFTVSDDGGYLASFKFDGSTLTEVGGFGDFVPDRYWQIDLAGLLNQSIPDSSEHRALEKMHIGKSTGFEGLAFKNSDSTNPNSMIIYIGAESEWDTDAAGPKIGNKIIAYDLSAAFNADGSWKTPEGKQPGKVRQIYDLGYAHKETTGKESNDPMPVVDENYPATFAGGLEALTFVPDPKHPRGGLFYAGRQADGKVYKIDLQENMGEGIIGTAKVAGKFTFDSIRNPNYPDLGSLQYVELNGSQHLLALFGEGPKTTIKGEQTPRDHQVNPDPVRIVLSSLDGHVTQIWDQVGDANSFNTDSTHWLSGLRGPEGISYFHVDGVPYLAISQDPGSEQRDQGGEFAPTDDGRIGLVKFFSGFNLEQPLLTSSIRVNDEITVAAIRGASLELPEALTSGGSKSLTIYQTANYADGQQTAYKTTSTVDVVHYTLARPQNGEYSDEERSKPMSYTFDTPDALEKWTVKSNYDQHSNTKYEKDNVTLEEDGGLRIKVSVGNEGQPLSGRIESLDRKKYGLFVYKTKQIPKAENAESMVSHLWPALWTVGWVDEKTDLWPLKGEIDVMETVRSQEERPDFTSRLMTKTLNFEVPINNENYYASIPENESKDIKTFFKAQEDWYQPHTFAVDWYPVEDASKNLVDVMFDFYLDVEVNGDGWLVPLNPGDSVAPIKSYSLKQQVEKYNNNPDNKPKVPSWDKIFEDWGKHGIVLNVAVGGAWNSDYSHQITENGSQSEFALGLPTDGSADMVVEYVKVYDRSPARPPASDLLASPIQDSSPSPLTVVIRHGHDWKEDSPNDYGERASEWAKTLEDGDITSRWLYDDRTIDPISDGGTLGLPKKIEKNGDKGNFRLNHQGSAEANSFAKVLPELVDSTNGRPISRIMVDSYARKSNAYGTPNPLDTVLPFILDTQTAPTRTHLDIDLVVRAENAQDADAWNHENVKGRLKPLSGEGSVLIASTGQGIWAKGDHRENPPNILDMLNSLYGLDDKKVMESGTEVEYLESKNWLKNHNHVKFDDVRQADKGTQIYVYGELDGDLSNGFEVEVYNQRVLNTFELGF